MASLPVVTPETLQFVRGLLIVFKLSNNTKVIMITKIYIVIEKKGNKLWSP